MHNTTPHDPHQTDGFGKSMPPTHPGQDHIAQPATLGRREIEGERTVAAARHMLAERFFVGGKDADALPPAGDGHIPLLSVRGGPDGSDS